MPSFAAEASLGKRKRVGETAASHKKSKQKSKSRAPDADSTAKSTKRSNPEESDADGEETAIQAINVIGEIVTKEGHHHERIEALMCLLMADSSTSRVCAATASVLCRVFTRFMAGGAIKRKGMSQEELDHIEWMEIRYKKYLQVLEDWMRSSPELETVALKLCMSLVKMEASCFTAWWKRTLARVVRFAYTEECDARAEFGVYLDQYEDVRFYVLELIPAILKEVSDEELPIAHKAFFDLLCALPPPPSKIDTDKFFAELPTKPKHPLLSLAAHKHRAEDAWVAVLQGPLSNTDTNHALELMTHTILPWFSTPSRLLDFLTDSYNSRRGETPYLALAGLFHLIQTQNLDYPRFYPQLYSLLDDSLLHSPHRSRFFRLLDACLRSTHLPAALVASFIKRLARLALTAPPAAIVFVVPWVYNSIKAHPQCAFLLHRVARAPVEAAEWEAGGFHDPFDMSEEDPLATGAIDSSAWELETLRAHYHPNVAALAGIVGQQFTKAGYSLEDFYEHSYHGLLDAELRKKDIKTPVVEWTIPPRIFTSEDGGLAPLGALLERAVGT